MGNTNGREDGGGAASENSNHAPTSRVGSADLMAGSPPPNGRQSGSPLLFTPQVPVVPLQRERGDGPPFLNELQQDESRGAADHPLEQGVPTLITWSYGGNNVAVEGSWDNWRTRKILQISGKDHSILVVLPPGIYHYKFIVDGTVRYSPDLPCEADQSGSVFNILDVHDYVPENLDSVAEFEVPQSPDSSYSQAFPGDEDFAKDPVAVPPQLQLSVLDSESSSDETAAPSSSTPNHVVLNHLFIEKGWSPQSMVAVGMTHRYQSKYVTVVLYKPLKR